MRNAHYEVTTFDFESKAKTAIMPRDEVAEFINDINWLEVSHFKVEAIEPLADWELELLNAALEVNE